MSDSDATQARARLVGTNHVALEVGDVEAALEFYASIFEFDLRGRLDGKAFIDMGDQFIALAETDHADEETDGARHVGLVVDDTDLAEARLDEVDADRVGSSGLDVRDPWGNRIQVVEYDEVQFTKADHVLAGMGLADLGKGESALEELAEKGMAPDGRAESGSNPR